jgi:hypothetical protein
MGSSCSKGSAATGGKQGNTAANNQRNSPAPEHQFTKDGVSVEQIHILHSASASEGSPGSPNRRNSTSSNKRLHMVPEQVNRDIREDYDIDNTDVLGFGASGVVKICVRRHTNRKYALKTIRKSSLRSDSVERLQNEISIMQEVDHPNILRLREVYEDNEKIYLISELCTGGNFCEKLQQWEEKGGLPETTACAYVYSIIAALRYLHAHNIIHRDLKLDNFLLEDESEKAEVKLTG